MFFLSAPSVSISEPEWPGVDDYPAPSPYHQQLESAQAEFETELASPEGWIDQGEKDGVKLSKKVNKDDKDGLPSVKGVCIVTGADCESFIGLIQLVGIRKRWDPRILDGFMLARTDKHNYSFYSCMAGFGWIVSPRDIVGANRNILPSDASGDAIIIQTSVVDDEHAPTQSGRVRATLGLSGWRLRPVDGGLEITYLARISLNGSLPQSIVNKIASETPTCAGRARDVFYDIGFPPFIRTTSAQPEPSCVFHIETFSHPRQPLEFHCRITTAIGAEFDLVYDKTKMFPSGVEVAVAGQGVEAVDDGEGAVHVKCATDGDNVDIALKAK